jgi:glycosyltransferase involved in cell wall biosynthesis
MVYQQHPPVGALIGYLERERPEAVLSILNRPNLSLLLASRLASQAARIAVSVQDNVGAGSGKAKKSWKRSDVPRLMRLLFPAADEIICCSEGVANDVARITGLLRTSVRAIANPVFDDALLARAREPIEHRWLPAVDVPVLLGVGKLGPKKGFDTLLRAFARVRSKCEARLVVLGEGSRREQLLELARKLGVADDFDLPGFVRNPMPYFASASLFVLSSAWEGFANVLVEAMSVGCPVVSTDCPSGPGEILAGGAHGELVRVGDDEEMAEAIMRTLKKPRKREELVARAQDFSVSVALERYEEALAGPPAITERARAVQE